MCKPCYVAVDTGGLGFEYRNDHIRAQTSNHIETALLGVIALKTANTVGEFFRSTAQPIEVETFYA